LQQANIGLEKIVVQSLRQAPATEVPLLAWPLVCGSSVSERTRALSFEDGVLTVEVADIGWKRELQTIAPRYLAAINRYTTASVLRIEFIVVRVGTAASNVR
jgi:hypothetical protein